MSEVVSYIDQIEVDGTGFKWLENVTVTINQGPQEVKDSFVFTSVLMDSGISGSIKFTPKEDEVYMLANSNFYQLQPEGEEKTQSKLLKKGTEYTLTFNEMYDLNTFVFQKGIENPMYQTISNTDSFVFNLF